MTTTLPNESGWRSKLTCFSPSFVEHEVTGQTLNFYPVSVGLVFKLRTIGRPLARSLTTLFAKNEGDQGTHDEITQKETGAGQVIADRDVTIMPISDGLAKIRHEQRIEAVDGLAQALTEESNAHVVGEIIMDSLADVFPKSDRNEWPPVKEFMETMPLPVLSGMVVGVVKANKAVFGPLADQASEAAEALVKKMATAAAAEKDSPAEDNAEPDVAGKIPAPAPTSG